MGGEGGSMLVLNHPFFSLLQLVHRSYAGSPTAFISLFGLKYNMEGRSPQRFGAPPISGTEALTVNICMDKVGKEGVISFAAVTPRHLFKKNENDSKLEAVCG